MTPTEVAAQKDELRRIARETRNSLSTEERAHAAQEIANRVLEAVPQEARTIAVYLANKNEANIDAASQALIDEGRVVVAPRVGVRPQFSRLATLEKLRTNARGLRFPDSDEKFSAWEIDVLVIPAVALDANGNRLGQGGGWYDKVLERARAKSEKAPLIIGVCYECQVVENVPYLAHDERVDIIITEERVLEVRPHDR